MPIDSRVTQIDVEMSFVDEEDIRKITEGAIVDIFKSILNYEVAPTFPIMTYTSAMERYGSDKPDTRFGMEIRDCSDLAAESGFRVFSDAIKKERNRCRELMFRILLHTPEASWIF